MRIMTTETPTEPMSGKAWLVPLLCLVTTGAMLGVMTNLAKVAGTVGLAPLPFLAWSVAGGAAILLALNTVKRRLPALNRRSLEYFLVAGLVSIAAPNLIFFAAVPKVGVSFVALCIAFPPLLTYLAALTLGMERYNHRRAIGVLLALAGAAYLAMLKLNAPDAPTVWIIATLIGPVFLAIGNIYRTFRWPPGARPDELAPGMLGAAGLLLLAAGLLPGNSLHVSTETSLPMILIAVQSLFFAAQYYLFFILQKRGGPVYLSLMGSVAAVFGVPVAVLLLGETPPDGLAIGAVLIALGIYFVTRGAKKK